MGIEPTNQLVTGSPVLKGIKPCEQDSPIKCTIPYNPFIIKGFPVFPVSVEIGKKRSYRERHGHKTVIKADWAEGKLLGRPEGTIGKNKLDGKEREIKEFLAKGVNRANIARFFEVTFPTLENFIQSRGLR
ncbi:MAG: hypothetical protein ABSC19_07395 [Syntrophorhabdales bacterium]